MAPAKVSQTVTAGQVITTSENGRAVLELDDGSLLELSKGSSLAMGGREKDGSTKTFFTLLSGQVMARVKKLSASDTFQISTPTAIAGVRGTAFSVSVADSGDSHIGVEEGSVEVGDADALEEDDSKTLTLSAKESAEVSLTGAPEKKTGTDMKRFSYDRWNADRQKQLSEKLPFVLDAMEKRFLMTAKAMAFSEEFLRRDGKALVEIHVRIEGALKNGQTVPPEALEMRNRMVARVAKVGAHHKMMASRLTAFGPVLSRIYQLGKQDPRVRSRMESFRKNAEGAMKSIEERRKNAAKEMENQRKEWKEKFGDARIENRKESPERDDRKPAAARDDRKPAAAAEDRDDRKQAKPAADDRRGEPTRKPLRR
jgi:hypothetical protein